MTNQDKSGAAKSAEAEEKARLERANHHFDETDVMFTDLSGEVYDATEILSGYHSEVRDASIAFAAAFALSELEAANKRIAELEDKAARWDEGEEFLFGQGPTFKCFDQIVHERANYRNICVFCAADATKAKSKQR